jgi:hypothetical protein
MIVEEVRASLAAQNALPEDAEEAARTIAAKCVNGSGVPVGATSVVRSPISSVPVWFDDTTRGTGSIITIVALSEKRYTPSRKRRHAPCCLNKLDDASAA